jgi:hypothetical protein
VTYKVYDGEDGKGKVVSEGFAFTGGDVDYTVKVSFVSRVVKGTYS